MLGEEGRGAHGGRGPGERAGAWWPGARVRARAAPGRAPCRPGRRPGDGSRRARGAGRSPGCPGEGQEAGGGVHGC